MSRSARYARCRLVWVSIGLVILAGCQWFLDDADREVYRLIEHRQRQTLSSTSDSRLPPPRARGPARHPEADATRHEFAPHPIDDGMMGSSGSASTRPAGDPEPPVTPETVPGPQASADAALSPSTVSGRTPEPAPAAGVEPAGGAMTSTPTAASQPAVEGEAATRPAQEREPVAGTPPASAPARQAWVPPTTAPSRKELTLSEALAYAFRHARQFQTAKEDLYLAALALSLERHLWTPRFFGELRGEYTHLQVPTPVEEDPDAPPTMEPDPTLEAVAEAGVRQRLPWGGEVTARVIDTLMRDLRDHATTGETGQAILEANIPLLRGAGPAAFESRFQAERDLIYAVRTFETFRRAFAVDIAGDFFNLQRSRQAIVNTDLSIRSLAEEAERARGLWETGRLLQLDVLRADQDRVQASNDRVDAVVAYESALDAFKIRIGMPTDTSIDVPLPQEVSAAADGQGSGPADPLQAALTMPSITEDEAIQTALKYRLDLMNDLDRIGDTERGVEVAENNLLPELEAFSSATFATEPDRLGVLHYDKEYTVLAAGLRLALPLDRKAERNALRQAHILRSRAERSYEEARDRVIQQVRFAMRRVQQQRDSLEYQIIGRDLALERRRYSQIRLATKGDISNRELVDAENFLLSARNRLAQAQAQLSLAILQFRRDAATLRIDDDGQWKGPVDVREEGPR